METYSAAIIYQNDSSINTAEYLSGQGDYDNADAADRGGRQHPFVVLVRTVRQARLVEQALLHAHVPYTLAGYRSFFETRAVRATVSRRSLQAGGVEVKARWAEERRVVTLESLEDEGRRTIDGFQPSDEPSTNATMRS